MTLNQILYFQRIAVLGNMGKAARELHISQPSLSVAIANLEKELNLTLFNRNGHNLEITPEGRTMLVHANKILAEFKAAQMHMQDLSSDRNLLIRIGCISPILWDLLPRVARAFIQEPGNAGMKFDFETDTTSVLMNMLREGRCDFLICSAYKDEGIQQSELLAEPYMMLCPPNTELPQTWKDLFAKGVIGFKEQTMASSEIFDMLSPHGIVPAYIHLAPDEASIASLVAHGFGCGIVPLVPFLKHYDLQIAPLPQPNTGMVRRIYVTKMRSHPPTGASRRFLRYLKTWVIENQHSLVSDICTPAAVPQA